MAETTVEILGERVQPHDEFSPRYTDKLVKRDDRVYLIHWMFSGIDSPRGGASRPYLFDVRQDQLAAVLEYFTPGADVLHAHFDHDVIAILGGCREIQPSWWAWDLR